ncbi:Pentatricopeptide repeat [Arabidopsis thaliana x Arabidopsis arenosa]|uniref:Pentatricopeptide repeat n=1 Tax=Arabidopsis thaliana x Arabidopsis arenosa TaxID=1240361 RepID=A0A8T1ZSL6_9BRAS|nr:Pentatricopeptide repeat [Arabidopsis thaliana x Arabidopsis arenosa]
MIGRLIHGRRFCTTVPRRAEDIISNPDCRPTDLCLRVSYLVNSVGDLDTAAKYARLAVFTRINSEYTATTCKHIIGGMLRDKRHKDAYDLYDFFFNKHKLKPNSHCCNHIIESRFQQGLVEEALDFHRSIKSSVVHDYPSHDTFRVLTKGLVHYGRLDQAEALLKAKTVTTYPDHVAYNNLIRGFLDLGNLDKANLVLDEFKRLFSLFRVEAMECYHQSILVANKLPVCPETGNALLKVLLKYGEKKHAWALYHEILDQSGTDNRRLGSDTVEIMVEECFDMGRCSEAIDTYSKAKARAKKKNLLGKEYIITRCCEYGMLSEAESLFTDSLFVTTFKTIIDAYVKAGRIDDAIKTSNKMVDAALKELTYLF